MYFSPFITQKVKHIASFLYNIVPASLSEYLLT